MSDLISTEEASNILNVSSRHVRRLIEAGHLAGRKISDRWVVEKSSVLAYKRKRESGEKRP